MDTFLEIFTDTSMDIIVDSFMYVIVDMLADMVVETFLDIFVENGEYLIMKKSPLSYSWTTAQIPIYQKI